MLHKIFMTSLVVFFIGGGVVYFATNPSYQEAFQARVYYVLGNYAKAKELASSAYAKNGYNKMAFTVMMQSTIALGYENYLKEGSRYLVVIDEISKKSDYTESDKAKVKMICDVMIDSYDGLNATKVTDKNLVKESHLMLLRFKELRAELF
ncbi:MAG: hypothetical protein PHN38_06130 [Sulfurospirillaceae bacterium]|nr:hypothetical protein [Sulfurospirillaceae bacterium]MDD3462239.1 hypothetical protein [Sulfurospirillaceae bacterium]